MLSRNAFNYYVKRSLSGRIDRAKEDLCIRIISDTDKLVPYDTGRLASEIDILPSNNGIRYSAEYAPFVVAMPSSTRFNREKHEKATSWWNIVSMELNKSKWYSFIRERLTDGYSSK